MYKSETVLVNPKLHQETFPSTCVHEMEVSPKRKNVTMPREGTPAEGPGASTERAVRLFPQHEHRPTVPMCSPEIAFQLIVTSMLDGDSCNSLMKLIKCVAS